eukprot:Anaeramoba_ignava/a356785_56.p1 GENE.a356785_56~~a356785_56.p1  ORF type:complete len:276 (-),score=-16.15 a356785_56:3-830(-)
MKVNLILIALVAVIFSACNSDDTNPVNGVNYDAYFTQISEGNDFSIAIGKDNNVYGWGRSINGVLGYNNSSVRTKENPVRIDGLDNIVELAAGTGHCLALREDGIVLAWGENEYGQLGFGRNNKIDFLCTPAPVEKLEGVRTISAGNSYSLAVNQKGLVYSWGKNNYGCLGYGTVDESAYPAIIHGLENIEDVVALGYSCLALDANGHVWTWGDNSEFRLGRYDEPNNYEGQAPAMIANLPEIRSIGVTQTGFYVITESNERILVSSLVGNNQGN